MKYAAISFNLDSLGEAYGFPPEYRDPTFFEVSRRFFEIAEKYKFKYSIYIIARDLEKEENRKRVKEWALKGHEIGNHSWSHPQNLGAMDKRNIHREIERAHKMIAEASGYEPKGFIAPGWCTSPEVVKTLVELKYSYDSSMFPSWIMFPAILKLLLNYAGDRRFLDILKRKNFLYYLFGPRRPYNTKDSLFNKTTGGVTILPLPTNRYRMACWHTLAFEFGWKIYEKVLRSCLKEIDAFYYLIHPADLMDTRDLKSGMTHLERLKTPLETKRKYLERSIEIILESGRKIVTMEELAARYKKG